MVEIIKEHFKGCSHFFETLKYGCRGILDIPITNSNQSLVFVVLNVPWNLLKRQLSYWVSSCQMCSACGFSLPLSSVLHPVRIICLKSKMNFNMILCCKMMLSACSLLLFLRRAVETWTYMFWSFMISSGDNSGGYQYGQRVCFSALWIWQSLHATVSHDPRVLDGRQVLGSVEWKRTILFYLKDEPIPISQLSFYLRCTSVMRKCLTSCQACKSKT